MDLNVDYLLQQIWSSLGLLRVYTKKRGARPDLEEPLVVRQNATVETCCHAIHRVRYIFCTYSTFRLYQRHN